MALHGVALVRELPFRLRRQARSGPTGERVRLVKTDVAHWPVAIDRHDSVQPVAAVLAIALEPVGGRGPALALRASEAVREPQLRPAIAPVTHEFEVFAGGREAGRELV